MGYLPAWAVGALLAGIAIVHWFLLKRMMAVSGRFTALVNRLREGPPPPDPKMTEAEIVAALAAATREEFGANASGMPEASSGTVPVSTPQSPSTHIIFLAALLVGGSLRGSFSAMHPVRSRQHYDPTVSHGFLEPDRWPGWCSFLVAYSLDLVHAWLAVALLDMDSAASAVSSLVASWQHSGSSALAS